MSMRKISGGLSARGKRNDDAILRAGIGSIFTALSEVAPHVAQLQYGLLGGLRRAQELEIRRLSEIDADDPRISTAERRATITAGLLSEAEKISDAAQKVAQGAVAGRMFHGYVLDAEGAPAVGYTVAVSREANAAGGKTLRAKTDEAGYFRIDFGKPSRKKHDGNPPEFVETFARMVERSVKTEDIEAKPAAAGMRDTATAETQRIRARVDVLDSKKKVVFRDPAPPEFDTEETVFRYYPLIDF